MKRSEELEKAVAEYLTLKRYSYFRVKNYRCYNCGSVGNSEAKGMPDFLTFHPEVTAIECKTGRGKLTEEQKEVKRKLEEAKVPYIIVQDTVDMLVEWFEDG